MDGTTERVLLSRFHVEGFPAIYHVHGAETRQFTGRRTLHKVAIFATADFCAALLGLQLDWTYIWQGRPAANLHALQLKDFALTDWKAEPALSQWKSPTSKVGRLWGQIQGYALEP